jgi:DNA repair protein RecN (Recombination protein N)
MGALNLILGQRADSAVLLDKGKKCIVEGSFSMKKTDLIISFFEEHELDADDTILLRREIAPNGKSRSFVNDTPVNLSQLKQLAVLLVDLHQQFDTLELGDADFQREVIDALSENKNPLNEYRSIYNSWKQSKKELEELQQQKNSFNKELDYNQFLFDELNELGLK